MAFEPSELSAENVPAEFLNKSIHIVKKGITDFTADCIVNAANEGLWEGGGVCGAIFHAAGSEELTKACRSIGHCDTGSAVITPAFRLNAKYIIHAVGPRYIDGKHGEPSQLYDCYKTSLNLAKENECHSIVFPVISAGIFGYPKKDAWRKAIQACVDFLSKNPNYNMQVSFAVLDSEMIKIGQNALVHGVRAQIFKDTIDWIDSEPDLSKSIAWAKQHTELFYEDNYPKFPVSVKNQTITVTKNRSYEAAMKLYKEDPAKKIAVMNFANAFHAGGGVTMGASAQEESLCRCSTLYPLLYRRTLRDSFYQHHKELNTSKASDSLIYTEGVVICKTDEDFPKRLPQSDWVSVDVITIAAPDLRDKSNAYAEIVGDGTYMNDAELFGYHVKRAIHMLTVAAYKKADILVLGAFGCGAFKNNPEVVAKAHKTALDVFPKVFERIEFAVYCSPKDQENYEIFRSVFCSAD